MGNNISEDKLQRALDFTFTQNDQDMNRMGLIPGQITDDSEMAMCLVHSLGISIPFICLKPYFKLRAALISI